MAWLKYRKGGEMIRDRGAYLFPPLEQEKTDSHGNTASRGAQPRGRPGISLLKGDGDALSLVES